MKTFATAFFSLSMLLLLSLPAHAEANSNTTETANVDSTAQPSVAQNDYQMRTAFYAAMQEHSYAQAVQIGRKILASESQVDDEFSLNFAYALLGNGDTQQAISRLTGLAQSKNRTVALKAQAEIALRSAATPRSYAPPSAVTVFGYTQNESRFGDTFYGMDVRHDFAKAGGVQPYAIVHFTDDSKSSGGALPQVYNDDATVISGGAEVHPWPCSAVFAEVGYSQGIRNDRRFWEDRFGARYYRDIGSINSTRPHTNFGATVALYSRFAGNGIAYGSVEHDVPLANRLRAVGTLNGGMDTKRLYYNNFAEIGLGVEYRVSDAVRVRVEAVDGTFLTAGYPVRANYTTARTQLLFGFQR